MSGMECFAGRRQEAGGGVECTPTSLRRLEQQSDRFRSQLTDLQSTVSTLQARLHNVERERSSLTPEHLRRVEGSVSSLDDRLQHERARALEAELALEVESAARLEEALASKVDTEALSRLDGLLAEIHTQVEGLQISALEAAGVALKFSQLEATVAAVQEHQKHHRAHGLRTPRHSLSTPRIDEVPLPSSPQAAPQVALETTPQAAPAPEHREAQEENATAAAGAERSSVVPAAAEPHPSSSTSAAEAKAEVPKESAEAESCENAAGKIAAGYEEDDEEEEEKALTLNELEGNLDEVAGRLAVLEREVRSGEGGCGTSKADAQAKQLELAALAARDQVAAYREQLKGLERALKGKVDASQLQMTQGGPAAIIHSHLARLDEELQGKAGNEELHELWDTIIDVNVKIKDSMGDKANLKELRRVEASVEDIYSRLQISRLPDFDGAKPNLKTWVDECDDSDSDSLIPRLGVPRGHGKAYATEDKDSDPEAPKKLRSNEGGKSPEKAGMEEEASGGPISSHDN